MLKSTYPIAGTLQSYMYNYTARREFKVQIKDSLKSIMIMLK